MTQSKHTPTPWEHDSRPTKYDGIPFINWVIYGAKDGADDQCREIADTFNASYLHDEETRAANAAFIVKAVNCHDGLVSGLYAAWQFIEDLKTAISSDDEGEILQNLCNQQKVYNALILAATGKCIEEYKGAA